MPGGAHAWLLFVFCGEFGRHFFSSAPLYYLTNFSAEESDAIKMGRTEFKQRGSGSSTESAYLKEMLEEEKLRTNNQRHHYDTETLKAQVGALNDTLRQMHEEITANFNMLQHLSDPEEKDSVIAQNKILRESVKDCRSLRDAKLTELNKVSTAQSKKDSVASSAAAATATPNDAAVAGRSRSLSDDSRRSSNPSPASASLRSGTPTSDLDPPKRQKTSNNGKEKPRTLNKDGSKRKVRSDAKKKELQ